MPVETCVAVACPDAEDECGTPGGWSAPEVPPSSHHNFAEWAHARTVNRLHGLKIQLTGHGSERVYSLHTFESGDLDTAAGPPRAEGTGPIGAPVALHPVDP